MKKKKWLIVSLIVLLILIVAVILYNSLKDTSKLTSSERTWINDNINNVNNIYVNTNQNIFGKDGHGVFYNFLNDITNEYGINFNVVANDSSSNNIIKLNYGKELLNNSKIFYKDHYVLVGKEKSFIKNNIDLENKNIGLLPSEETYIKTYLKDIAINYKTYDNIDNLYNSLNSETEYIILPRMEYIDSILKNDYQIIYHFSDINCYYTLDGIGDTLSSILYKYFDKWQEKIDKYIKEEEFKIFINSLDIKETDIDKLLSVDYEYGFINNSPYEVIMSGKYGGIIATYLQEFSSFSGVYFNISKYSNKEKLIKAIDKNKVDLFFDFNLNIADNYLKTDNGILTSVSIITRNDNEKVFNSLYSLKDEEVYVEDGSNILKYLMNIEGLNIHTYSNKKELYKLNKEDVIIALDTYKFNYLKDNKLNNYVSKYDTFINSLYTFKIKNIHPTLQILLNSYLNYLDTYSMINKGLNSHLEVVINGNILNNIAKYIILVIFGLGLIGFIIYKNTKKIRIARKLKKDEKIRFIDELTCLKNRAYLSDFMKTWSNNTLYPQAIVVVDLNKLTEINEKYGVAEGDKQIQAFANALIKTQLDNSDLMRSDGNEFVIYTIGYSQKQIINYIHKLSKELKRLPYNYGAEFGYSIIENNLKTIEDALTEAIEDMKDKKGSK